MGLAAEGPPGARPLRRRARPHDLDRRPHRRRRLLPAQAGRPVGSRPCPGQRARQALAALLAIALLAALAATQTVTDGRDLGFEARLPGVAVAIVAVLLRAPFIAVVAAAAATAALVRLAA